MRIELSRSELNLIQNHMGNNMVVTRQGNEELLIRSKQYIRDRILAVVTKWETKNGNHIPHWMLQRKVNVDQSILNEALEALLESGRLEYVTVNNGVGRPACGYRPIP